MTLLTLQQISLSFGDKVLLDKVDLVVKAGERIGIMGRNGTGKSTLMKLIAGLQTFDDGIRSLSNDCRFSYLPQAVPTDMTEQTLFDVVAAGLSSHGNLLSTYERVTHALDLNPTSETLLQQLTDLQTQIDTIDGWRLKQRVEAQLTRFSLDGTTPFAKLSGGMKRRTLLAKAMVSQPNLLILDEPTNHLDIEAIEFLEKMIHDFQGALLIISHDRHFLQKTINKIIELDRAKLYSYASGFDNYYDLREQRLASEQQANARLDKKLSEEEAWIRQGIKARRTRNQGRVRALHALRAQIKDRVAPQSSAKVSLSNAPHSGKEMIVADQLRFHYPDQAGDLILPFSMTITRGDKVAIVGPNGVGKSTLLKLLLDLEKPSSGKVKLGTHVEVAYFDQMRAAIDPEQNLRDNVAAGKDTVRVNNKEQHINSYLRNFLFSDKAIYAPASTLSGGETNRLLLAKLFTKPANLLVMDEPTNDLDIETLELLEELLADFGGTLLLVSHDRMFIDRIATHTIAMEGEGIVNSYVGGYSDWQRQRQPLQGSSNPKASPNRSAPSSQHSDSTPDKKADKKVTQKKSYKAQRELEQLPHQIESTETDIAKLQQRLSDPSLYQTASPEQIAELNNTLQQLQSSLTTLYDRWETLEE